MRTTKVVALVLCFTVGGCSDSAAPRREVVMLPAAELVYEGFPAGTSELLRLAADGAAPARLLPAGTLAMDPAASPDGRRIAFVVASYDSATGDIWLVNADGSGLRRLTDDPELDDSPAWSPDGRKIVFRSYRSLRDGELWTLDVESGALANLTPAQGTAVIDHRRPAWSPDGRAIAFRRSNAAQGSDIVIVPADGGDAVRLALPGEQRTPAWHPDGTRIAFASQTTPLARPELFTIRPDGSGAERVTREDDWGGGLNPAWRRTDR